MQAGDLIRLVPASRVMTSFPSGPASYIETNRRWVKNLLINAPRFRAWRDVLAAYLGIVLATTILVGPIAAIVVGRRAFIVPSTAAVIATINRLRRLALGARRTNVEITPRLVASLPFFVLLDQVAVLLAAFDSISATWPVPVVAAPDPAMEATGATDGLSRGTRTRRYSGTSRYVDRLDAGLRERGVNVIRLSTTPRGYAVSRPGSRPPHRVGLEHLPESVPRCGWLGPRLTSFT